MKLATTTEDFRPYCSTYLERVQHICDAGFKYIDLGMYIVQKEDALILSDDWRSTAKELLEYAKSRGASFVQAHSPGGNPFDPETGEQAMKNAIRSILVCGELGIKNIVFHGGSFPGINRDEYFEQNRIMFGKLLKYAEEYGINLLCENTTAKNLNNRYGITTGSEALEMVKYIDHPLFHFCWDTGHANVEGDQYDEIKALGKDLYALHVNDNRGGGDEHVMPWFGTLNLDQVINALIKIGYDGYFTFESGSTLRPAKYWLGSRREFEKDTRLAAPQLFMQDALEKLMYEMGEYALKSYNFLMED